MHKARVPGPIASIRNQSSPAGAAQTLIGRGSTRFGAASMKNCPGVPGSRLPRTARRSVYAPTCSTATTLSASRLSTDPLLERQDGLAARVGDRVRGRPSACECGDAGDPRGKCRLADPVTVAPRTGAAARRVDDEVAASASDKVDYLLTLVLLPYLANAIDRDARRRKRFFF